MEKKQVILDYDEHQEMLKELQKFRDYQKLLEDRDDIILLGRGWSQNWNYGIEYCTVIKGIAGVTDELEAREKELKDKIEQVSQFGKQYIDMRDSYDTKAKNLSNNWFYNLFYSKKN